jgi:Uma2 family endonuclease
MATSALVPVSEYLKTMCHPDCDYVDGEVQERNLGEQDHSDLQTRIAKLLGADAHEEYLWVNTELRVQVNPTRFRVPDVCVRRADAPSEQIVRTAPLLCIEVLSSQDTVAKMRTKVRDYLEMGVPEVWVVEPDQRTVSIYSGVTMLEKSTGELSVPRTPVVVTLADIFKVLDRHR